MPTDPVTAFFFGFFCALAVSTVALALTLSIRTPRAGLPPLPALPPEPQQWHYKSSTPHNQSEYVTRNEFDQLHAAVAALSQTIRMMHDEMMQQAEDDGYSAPASTNRPRSNNKKPQ